MPSVRTAKAVWDVIMSPLTANPLKATAGVMVSLSGKPIQLAPLPIVIGCSAGSMSMPSSVISQSASTFILHIRATSRLLNDPLHLELMYEVLPFCETMLMLVPGTAPTSASSRSSRVISTRGDTQLYPAFKSIVWVTDESSSCAQDLSCPTRRTRKAAVSSSFFNMIKNRYRTPPASSMVPLLWALKSGCVAVMLLALMNLPGTSSTEAGMGLEAR